MNCIGVPNPFFYLISNGDPNVPSLLYYTHIPVAIITIILGIFIYRNNKKGLANRVLFGLSIVIFLMIISNILAWVNNIVPLVIFSWDLDKIMYFILPILAVYPYYTLVFKKDISNLSKSIWLVILSAYSLYTFSSQSLIGFDITNCDLYDQPIISYIQVAFVVYAIILLTVIFLRSVKNNKDKTSKKVSTILFASMSLFIINLFFIYQIAYYFTDYSYELYAFIGLPIFLGAITFTVVKYKTFNIKMAGAQALVWALVILVGSEFFFITGLTSQILMSATLVVASVLGFILVRNVKSEILHRENIERLAKELEISNGKLKELDQMKSEFLSLATHQIRSPLAAIKGYISLISEGDYGEVPQTFKEPLDTIFKSTDSLSKMVTDFLDVSRLDLGQMKYEFSDFDFRDLANEVIKELSPGVKAKGLELKINITDRACPVKADRVKLKQVLNNLMDNSSKYTKQGWMEISVENKGGKALFAVKDTGVGISPKTMAVLFQRFSRAKNANDVNILGTGLGLYVAKKMAEGNNGRVWAESEGEGKGAQFYVELPLILK